MNDPAYDLYKQARNRICKLHPIGLIELAVKTLHKVSAEGIDAMARFQPWDLLLLIKWTAQQADPSSHRRSRIATSQDFNFLLDIFNQIENSVKMPLDYPHHTLYLRKLAFQQFGLQHGPDGSALARQLSLFGALPANHRLQREFLEISGVSIHQFCLFSSGLLLLALNTPPPMAISSRELQKLELPDEPGSLGRFMIFVSKSLHQLYQWFKTEEFAGESIEDQRILPSPLTDAPLLRLGPANFIIYYLPLLLRSLEKAVYRTLRRKDPSSFGDDFGPLFERYVTKCLDCAGVTYLDEKALQAALTGSGKCVDFLIVEEGCNILIDAKAVEMSPLGRLSHRAEQLSKALSASINAMGQGMATCQRMRAKLAGSTSIFGGGETYLMVVTFDDLYLGSPHDFRIIFGETILPRLEETYPTPLPIPFENMFFLSMGEFENLLELVRTGQTTFVKAIRHAIQQDGDYRTKKFRFEQHLETLATSKTRLPISQEAFEAIHEEALRLWQG